MSTAVAPRALALSANTATTFPAAKAASHGAAAYIPAFAKLLPARRGSSWEARQSADTGPSYLDMPAAAEVAGVPGTQGSYGGVALLDSHCSNVAGELSPDVRRRLYIGVLIEG